MELLGAESIEQRELIIAVKMEGRTYHELASEAGVSGDAIRMRLRRALDSLTTIYRRLEN